MNITIDGYGLFKVLVAARSISPDRENDSCLLVTDCDMLKIHFANESTRILTKLPVIKSITKGNYRFELPIQKCIEFFKSETKRQLRNMVLRQHENSVFIDLKNGRTAQFPIKKQNSLLFVENYQVYKSDSAPSGNMIKCFETLITTICKNQPDTQIFVEQINDKIAFVAKNSGRLMRITLNCINTCSIGTEKKQHAFSVSAIKSLCKCLVALKMAKIYVCFVITKEIAYFSVAHPSFHIVTYGIPGDVPFNNELREGKYRGVVNRQKLFKGTRSVSLQREKSQVYIEFDGDLRKIIVSPLIGPKTYEQNFQTMSRHEPFKILVNQGFFLEGLKNATQDIVSIEYGQDKVWISSEHYEYMLPCDMETIEDTNSNDSVITEDETKE